jgi:transposase
MKPQMKSLETYYIGIDISKDKLDVFTRHDGQVRTIANQSKSIAKLITELVEQSGKIHLACEATGGYEKPLLKAAFKADCAISLMNARCVRSFADAMSKHAKTDAIDAEMITRFAEVKEPSPMVAPSATQEALQALSRRRTILVTRLTQEKNALQQADNTIVKRDIKSTIQGLKLRIAKIEKELDKIVTGDAELKAKRARMESVKGIGRVSSNAILSEMPELGSLTDKQASALVGVAPFDKDSGKHKGKRMTKGGRGRLRRALYMGAQSASRFNHVLSEFYERLKGKGKSHRVAVIAVMRKLVCLLNRMLSDADFKPSEVSK